MYSEPKLLVWVVFPEKISSQLSRMGFPQVHGMHS